MLQIHTFSDVLGWRDLHTVLWIRSSRCNALAVGIPATAFIVAGAGRE